VKPSENAITVVIAWAAQQCRAASDRHGIGHRRADYLDDFTRIGEKRPVLADAPQWSIPDVRADQIGGIQPCEDAAGRRACGT